jgi:YesN/AraC family two-component response regulator
MKIYEQLTRLLTLLMQESWNPENRPSADPVKKKSLAQIKSYLETHYREKISLDSLASDFFINKFYLTRIFKEQYGTTITSYILDLRITSAKHLLRFTDLSMDSISDEIGMKDANYFSRVFKKIEGMSPGAYRRNWTQD